MIRGVIRGTETRRRRLWAAAALAALAWHGLLLGALRPARSPRPRRPPKPPSVRYLPGPHAGASWTDARWLWSPVLFSLPSPVGFSRVRDEGESVRTPLAPPPPAPRFRDAPPAPPEDGPAVLPPRTSAAAAHWNGLLDGAAPAFSPGPRGPLRLAGAWLADDFERGPADPPAALAARAWEARAQIEFDPRGVPERVLVDPPGEDPAFDRELARWLWSWRLKPGRAARDGRLRLVFAPAGEAAP